MIGHIFNGTICVIIVIYMIIAFINRNKGE
jgi:hypothetical protein